MKRFKKILFWILIIITLAAISAYIVIPKVIRSEINQKAQNLELSIESKSIDININHIVLNQVSISSPFFPDQKARLNKITVELDWFTPKRILIDGGSIELNGSPDTLKSQFTDWKNRKTSGNVGNSKTNASNRILVKNISLIWKNWRSTSKLEIHEVTFKDKVITTGAIDTKIANKLIQISSAKYDITKPTELYLGSVHVSPTKPNGELKSDTSAEIPEIPEIPKNLEPTWVFVEKLSVIHGRFIIKAKNANTMVSHGDLVGITLGAEQLDVNNVLLDQFDATLTISVTEEDHPDVWINTSAGALRFSHTTLLNQEIEVKKPGANLQVVMSPDGLKWKGHIDIDMTRFSVSGTYDLEWIRGKITMEQVRCQDLLDSIPLAMKPTINGMKLKGNMSWEVQGDINPDKSDTSIRMKLDNQCKVISVPDALSISKLRKPFKRYVYNAKNELVEIESGPGVTGWTPISLTSMFIPIAIQTMEDPGFLAHRGFDIQAIENSIRDNIKEGRFAKGASTISMQLAKNLWLNRDKTISRKVQEAFLTIYLEQKLRKSEILELYVNVVEFGPDLYGIGKASPRYFKKHSANLSLGQAMFLASILPRPKNYYFDANGKLIPSKLKFLHRAMKAMRDRKVISEDEYQQGIKEVIVFGRASTDAETMEKILVNEEDGISPDSWETN